MRVNILFVFLLAKNPLITVIMVKKGFFNDKCRCCLQNGTLTNMWDEHVREGEEEIYGEMMNKCFAIAWQKHEKDTEKICELCITRLRDAIDFKKMVLTSEQVLLEYDEEIDDAEEQEKEEECDNVFVEELHFEEVEACEVAEHSDEYMEVEYLEENVPSTPPKPTKKKDIKNSKEDILSKKSVPVVKLDSSSTMRIKMENSSTMRIKMENNANCIEEILRKKSVPVVKLNSSSNMRVKMENNANCIDKILSGTSVPVVKLESCKTACTYLRVQTENDDKKAALPKRSRKIPTQSIKPILPKKSIKTQIENSSDEEFIDDRNQSQPAARRDNRSVAEERKKYRDNVRAVLLCSNATPINLPTDQGYGCEFCTKSFRDPFNLKRHILSKHDDDVKSKYKKDSDMRFVVVNLDITGLYCTLCYENIDTIENLLDHLKSVHDKNVHTDITRLLVPFKIHGSEFKCCMCEANYATFRMLSLHMTLHFNNFQCNTCGKFYISKLSLKRHRYLHATGVYPCSKCPKIFDSTIKRAQHEKHHYQKLTKAKCGLCGEIFNSFDKKIRHLTEVHGFTARVHKCNACGKNLSNQKSLLRHTHQIHMKILDYKCDICEKEFGDKRGLRNHILKHKGGKNYYCTICNKGFMQNRSLISHYEAHKNAKITSRRLDELDYTCEVCGRKFPRQRSMRRHMREQHLKSEALTKTISENVYQIKEGNL